MLVHQDPRLEIVKSIATDPAPPEDGYERGDTIHYSIVVTNSGTVTLTDVTVADPNADGFDAARDCDRDVPAATLAPGGRITCTAEHEVTQGDVDAGSFTNVATTTSGETPDASDDEVVLFTPTPVLRLAKTVTSTGPYELGDTVTYSLVATNAGNVTLHGVSITESEGAVLGRCTPLHRRRWLRTSSSSARRATSSHSATSTPVCTRTPRPRTPTRPNRSTPTRTCRCTGTRCSR